MSKTKAEILEFLEKYLSDQDKVEEIRMERSKVYGGFDKFMVKIEGVTEESG